MAEPIYPGLARRGIDAVADDAPAGMEPGGFARDLVQMFRSEFEGRFLGGSSCHAFDLAPAAAPRSRPSGSE